jgi:alpha-tubulin suppressor-like RCC1 family protein/ribosomal protein L27
MKKNLLFISLISITKFGFAQEVPNGGFKTFSSNTPGSWTAAAPSSVGKATGERRIRVNPVAKSTNDDTTSVYVAAYNSSGVKSGVIVSGTGSKTFAGEKVAIGGFKATQKPAVLSGFLKYKTGSSNHGGISVIVSHWNTSTSSRDTLGKYIDGVYPVDVTNNFTFFNLPITYNPLLSSITPDSIQIVLMSSNSSPLVNETAAIGDTLFVDLLRFSTCTPDPNVTIGTAPTIYPSTPGIKPGASEYAIANSASRDISLSFTVAIPSPAQVRVLGFPITISPLDSIHFNGISNLPAGLSLTCGHPSCTVYGNTIGCYTISGTLPSANDVKYYMEAYQTTWGYSSSFATQSFGNGNIQEQGARTRDTIIITVGTPTLAVTQTVTPGPTISPLPVVTTQTIDGGVRHSVFLCSNGTAKAVGENTYGGLGNGTNTNSDTPVAVSNLTGLISVSAGQSFTLFLKSDSTVWACGDNSYGQLGDGTNTNRNIPIQITSLKGIVAVSAGYKHSLFLKNDGTVWACGANVYAPILGGGMLGDGTQTNRKLPVKVNGLSNIVAVSGGASFSLFLKNDGTVWSCGANYFGQLGTGGSPLSSVTTPAKVSSLTGIRAIAAGFDHSLFLKNDGTVYGAGLNICGEMADGTTSNKSTPVKIKAVSEIVAIDAGSDHFLYLKNDGTVWASGINGEGELGSGVNNFDERQVVKTNITGVNAISAGDYFSLYSKSDSTVWASGLNTYSQLGDGTFINKMLPVKVSNLCSVYSKPIVTGIQEYLTKNLVVVYPNPSSGTIQIVSADAKILNIEISNMLGETIYLSQVNSDKASIDLSKEPNGIYVVKISTSKGITIEKLILNR